MKKLVIAVALAALVFPAAALAHPLGNFTINRFTRLEVSGHRVYARYVLDMAEIPTFQARQEGIDPAAYARRIAAGLRVAAIGKARLNGAGLIHAAGRSRAGHNARAADECQQRSGK